MTTKNDFKRIKEKSFLSSKIYSGNDQQCSNFNLNQNQKCFNKSSASFVQSQSKSSNNKFLATCKLLVSQTSTENSKTWNKSSKNGFLSKISNPFNSDDKEVQKRWKRNDSDSVTTKNSSTLSLHIAAYENAIETSDNDMIDKKDKTSSFGSAHERSILSKAQNKNSFEFPRQQQKSEGSKPEIAEFKSSQVLLNPNKSKTKQTLGKPANSKSHHPLPPPLSRRPSAADIEHCEDSEECESWWDFFRMFDRNHDGLIPVNELKRAVSKNRHFFHISPDEVHDLIETCDKNGDAMIDFPEFCEIMCKTKHQRLKQVAIKMGNAVLPKSKQAKATSYLVEYTCWPPPIFIILISIMEVTMYFYYAADEGFYSDRPAPTHSIFALNPYSKGEVWRYFTYVFTHNGFMHLIPNVVMQLILGISLELVHKGLRIAAIYFIGAFTGALLFFCFDPKVYLVGASGGVYALITAHLADTFLNWSEMPFRWVRVALFSVWVIADFSFAIYSRYFAEETSKVAVTGHLGGAFAGLFLGILVLRNLEKKKCERIVWWISLAVFSVFVLTCIIYIIVSAVTESQ